MMIMQRRKRSIIHENRLFNTINVMLMLLLTLLIAYPVWNLIVSSFSDARHLTEGGITLYPKGFTLENYRAVFRDTTIWRAFGISIAKTVLGVLTHVFFCSMVAFAMSKRYLIGRRLYSAIGIITIQAVGAS